MNIEVKDSTVMGYKGNFLYPLHNRTPKDLYFLIIAVFHY